MDGRCVLALLRLRESVCVCCWGKMMTGSRTNGGNLNGGSKNDTLTGGSGNDHISGGSGNDLINGGGGNDNLDGGSGDDTIAGGDGNDDLNGAAGNDVLDGGSGNDDIRGDSGNDRISGGDGDDDIKADSGDDWIDGGAGSDDVDGGSGNDTLVYAVGENGWQGHDDYEGGSGTDTLRLVMNRSEWMNPFFQLDLIRLKLFLAANTRNGQWNAVDRDVHDDFQFLAFNLHAADFEKIEIVVDGKVMDLSDQGVTLKADAITTSEDEASLAVDVLANDSAPDLVSSISFTQPGHGIVAWAPGQPALTDPVSPAQAKLIYTPDPSYYQYLAKGQTATDSFTYKVIDADGDWSVQTVTVTITGNNDAPILAADAVPAHALEELAGTTSSSALDTASATLAFTDVDLSNTHNVSSALASSSWSAGIALPADLDSALAGALSVSRVDSTGTGNGSVTAVFALADKLVDFLAAGETLTLVYNVTIADNDGGSATRPVTFVVSGTNDAPVITSAAAAAVGAVAEAGNLDDGTLVAGTASATGQLSSADVDHGATASWSGNAAGIYGAFAIDAATGVWTYTLDNTAGGAADQLAEGETRTETFLATVTDDKGASATQAVTVTVAGTNDSPVITSSATAATGLVIEAGNRDDGTIFSGGSVALGVLTSSDVDHGATASWSGNAAGIYGSFAIDAATGVWTYTLDNSKGGAADQLAEGETRTETFLATVTDDKGATATQAVTVTVTGSNDSPVISSGASAATGLVIEAGNRDDGTIFSGGSVALGVLTSSDVDHGATASWSGNAAGIYGAFAIDAATGVWTYTLDNSKGGAADQLAEGETRTETFLATVTDDKGATATQAVTVTVAGTNDSPVITSSATAATGLVIEAGNRDDGTIFSGGSVALGVLTSSDVDHGATASWSGNAAGIFGAFAIDAATGVWTYTLDNMAGGAADQLAEGETRTETFLATVTDDKGATATQAVTVTVAGTNDSPVITSGASAATGLVIEAGNRDDGTIFSGGSVALGVLTSSDVDHGATASWSGNAAGIYGAFAIDAATGIWTYTLDNSKGGAADQLAEGETRTETFLATVTDDKGATATQAVTVTVTGSNDSPVISSTSADAAGAVSEAGLAGAGEPGASGTLSASDVDHGATATWSGNAAGVYGAFAIDAATGHWTYTLDNSAGGAADRLAVGETHVETFTATVTDDKGATATQTVTVTVTGGNDAPVIVADATTSTGAVTEIADFAAGENASQLAAAGTIAFADVDTLDVHSASVAAQGANYLGSFSLGAVDQANDRLGWSFSVADKALDFLAAGQTLVQKYDVIVSDGHGGSAVQTVTVTLTGTNDAPEILAAVPDLSQTANLLLGAPAGVTVTGIFAPGSSANLLDGQPALTTTSAYHFQTTQQSQPVPYTTGYNYMGGNGWFASHGISAASLAGGTVLFSDGTIGRINVASDGAGGTESAYIYYQAYQPGHAFLSEIAGVTGGAATLRGSIEIAFADVDLADRHAATASAPNLSWSAGAPVPPGLAASLSLSLADSSGSGSGKVTADLAAADRSLDFLAAGETLTISYVVNIDDGHGGSAATSIAFTIAGTNDGPVIISAAEQAAGAVTEAGSLDDGSAVAGAPSATGTLASRDVDHGATASWSGDAAGTYGTFVIDPATGKWTYTLDNAKGGAADQLAEGEVKTETFLATVTDDKGATATQLVTVTVTGTNDAPVITTTEQAARSFMTEAGLLSGQIPTTSPTQVWSQLQAADVDHGAVLTWSGNAIGLYGSFAIDPVTGIWTYTLDNSADSAADQLAIHERVVDTFLVTVTDDKGATATQQVDIVIDGTNDAPVITSAAAAAIGSVAEAGTADDGALLAGMPSATGTLTSHDPDHHATATWSGNATGIYGSFAIDPATGTWTYMLDNGTGGAADQLAEGEVRAETFLATVTDQFGASATQIVTINVTGTNDAPVITSTEQAARSFMTEAGLLSGQVPTTSPTQVWSQLQAADVDHGAVLTWSGNAVGSYGSFGIDPVTGVWTYTLDNSPGSAADQLAVHERVVETFLVTVTDEKGATATQQVNIVIDGTNDAPVITSGAAAAAGALIDGGDADDGRPVPGVSLAQGQLSSSDVDHGASASWSGSAAGTYGNFLINPMTGEWTYTLDDSRGGPADQLAEGETGQETFLATVTDEHGASASQLVTITVTGNNDRPIITSAPEQSVGQIVEAGSSAGGQPSASGQLSSVDYDHGATTSWSGSRAGFFGSFSITPSGAWTYALDNASGSAADQLAEGEQLTETFLATVTDDKGASFSQLVIITIVGANDAPVIASTIADATGAVIEAGSLADGSAVPGTPSATGTLASHDPDHDATATWSGNASGAYGAFAIDAATGQWTYSLDQAAADKLGAGETRIETFLATVTDDKGATATQLVTVTVTGSNDAPVVTSATLTAGNVEPVSPVGTLTNSGTILFTDADLGDAHSVSAVPVGTTSGTLTVTRNADTTGTGTGGKVTWNYAVPATAVDYLAAGESKVERFTVTIDDGHGGVLTREILVTIAGTNDAPIVTGQDVSGAVTEQGTPSGNLTDSGFVNFSDADLSDVHNVTVTPVGTPLGSLTATKNGDTTGTGTGGQIGWTYSVAASAVESLAAGQTRTESFNVLVSDNHGGSVLRTVSVVVTGTNDAPTIVAGSTSATGALTELAEGAAGEGSATRTATGTIKFADVDTSDTHGASVAAQGSSYVGTLTTSVNQTTDAVSWTYSVSDGALDFLAAGETRVQTYAVTVADGKGGTAVQNVVITLTGSNDAPVITSGLKTVDFNTTTFQDPASWTEDGLSFTSPSHLHFDQDLDGDGHPELMNHGGGSDTAYIQLAAGGRFTLVDVDATYGGGGTVEWIAYRKDANGNLVETGRQTITSTGHVTLSSAFQNIDQVRWNSIGTLTIDNLRYLSGSALVPANVTEIADGAAGENATLVTRTGTVTFVDADLSDTHSASVVANGANYLGSFTLDPVDQAADSLGYTFAVQDSALDRLAAGQVLTQSYTVTIDDGHGGTSSQVITLTLTGTNDAPMVTAAVTGAAVEDGAAATLSALANASDVDGGAVLSIVNVGALPAGVVFDAATQSFTLDPANPAYQALAAGEQIEVKVDYSVSDGLASTPASASWTVTGTNDAPTITSGASAAAGTVTEAGNLDNGTVVAGTPVASGQLAAADVDHGATLTWSGSAAGAYGNFSLGAAGAWTYTLDNSRAATQALTEGQSVTETFLATVTDEKGATASRPVTITVNGTNDSPTLDLDVAVPTTNPTAIDQLFKLNGSAVQQSSDVLTLTSDTLNQSGSAISLKKLDFSQSVTFDFSVYLGSHDSPGADGIAFVLHNDPRGASATGGFGIGLGVSGIANGLAIAFDTYQNSGEMPQDHTSILRTSNFTSVTTPQAIGNGNVEDGQFHHVVVSWDATTQTLSYTIDGVAMQSLTADLVNAYFAGSDTAYFGFTAGTGGESNLQQVRINQITGVLADAQPVYPAYVEDGAAVHLAGTTVAVGDAGEGDLVSLTIDVTGLKDGGTEVLGIFGARLGLGASGSTIVPLGGELFNLAFDAATARVTITAVDGRMSAGAVQGLLTALSYADLSQNPTAGLRDFAFRLTDAFGATSSLQTAHVNVTPVNDAPVVSGPVSGTATEDGSAVTLNALATASDPDSATLSVIHMGGLPAGVSYASATHSFTLDPGDAAYQSLAAGQSTIVNVTYDVSDGALTAPGSVSWTVTGANDAPIASPDSAGGSENRTVPIDVLANDLDVDQGATRTLVSGSAPAGKGSVTVSGNQLLFNPGTAFDSLAPGQSEVVTLSYTMRDQFGATSSSTVTYTVTGANDAPTLGGVPSQLSVVENGSFMLAPSVTFGDVDNNVAGGKLVVSGLLAEDRVTILDQGTGVGQIGVSGANVSYGGLVIGTLAGGIGSTLTVTLNSNASVAAVDALIQNLAYADASDAPTASRTLLINVVDGAGAELPVLSGFAELTGAANPFAALGGLQRSVTATGDLDGDGDLDLVAAGEDGTFAVYRNDGGSFTRLTGAANPFNGLDTGNLAAPALVDINGDGRIDLVAAGETSGLRTLINNGNGSFTELFGAANPVNGLGAYHDPAPSFADIDNDGDMDLVVGEFGGVFHTFKNSNGVFAEVTGAANPFNGFNVGTHARPAFVDLDGDGDLDMVSGSLSGVFSAFRNNGDGSFTQLTGSANPFNGINGGFIASAGFLDVTGDGRADLLVGSQDSFGLRVFKSAGGVPVTVNVTSVNDAPETVGSTQSVVAGAGAVRVGLSGSDVDGNVASFRITDLPANGQLYADAGLTQLLSANSLVTASGNAASVWFKPNGGYAGSTSFHFAAVDNLGLADASPATATINVASGAEGLGVAAKASANVATSMVDVRGILAYGTPSLERINIVYVVDASGSVGSANFKNEIAGFKALTSSLIAQGVSAIANVTVIQFDTNSVNQGNFTLATVNAKLDSLAYTAGSSYYLSAFTAAYNALAAKPDGWDLIYFVSDGTPNPSTSQDPTSFIGQTIAGSGRAVSIEDFGYLATSSAGQTNLERWDTNHYTNVTTTTNLAATMSQSQIQAGVNLGSLTVSVDGGPATSLVGGATYGPLGVSFSASIQADLTDGLASRVVISGVVDDAATALDPAVTRTAQTVHYVGDPGLATLFDINSLEDQPAILRGFDADDRLDLDGALGVTLTLANAGQYVSLSAFMDLDQDGAADDRMVYVDPTGTGHFTVAALQLIDPVGVTTVQDLLF